MEFKISVESFQQRKNKYWKQLAQVSIELANDGILWLSNTGKIIYANKTMSDMLGYESNELLLFSINDIHPEIPDYAPYFAQLKKHGGRDIVEAKYKTKQGEYFPVEISGNYAIVDGFEFNCCIIRNISERKNIEAQFNSNYLAIQQQQRRIRELSRTYIKVQEEERQSISIEIHDQIIQRLVTLMRSLEELDNIKVYEHRQQLIRKLIKSVSDGIAEARNLMKALFPSSLKRYGLVNLFDQELTEIESTLHCKYKFTSNIKTKLNHEVETTLYRIGHEALTNIVKHGHNIQNVTVSLLSYDDEVELHISDDGQGFDIHHLSPNSIHRGIECMCRRAELMNGSCMISSKPGAGTSIKIRIPTMENIHSTRNT
ncbi:MAG: PAS domain S-box protein [Dehalogenimonas sp.]